MDENVTPIVEESLPALEDYVEEVDGDTSPIIIHESADYTEMLGEINDNLLGLQEVGGYIEGCLIFFTAVLLCYFGYKFLRIFF